ncbi:hypothetical protein [Paralcaligenes ureilyticus]|uniref:DUF2489 domain-containing protein n=1 Tax=Paralcaligenes ureilyticus TaxID=627131 RepID=A0A4R3M4P9_9BURK|nr:hypothetical protein [Paralcaligenes ureilyticus]TCT06367.1 hypothetical protein EDC26_108103 [Paralcaligenes ureilyticus]
MKDYVAVVAAIIAGIFAVVSAFIAWRLKNSSDDRARKVSLEKERRDEIKGLYENTFVLFEQAIRQVQHREQFTLAREFSQTNAKIHLLAPQEITDRYLKVACLLEDWSQLHAKASPRQLDLNGQTVTLIQSPDSTAAFKEPARAAYESLITELRSLTKAMREGLIADA